MCSTMLEAFRNSGEWQWSLWLLTRMLLGLIAEIFSNLPRGGRLPSYMWWYNLYKWPYFPFIYSWIRGPPCIYCWCFRNSTVDMATEIRSSRSSRRHRSRLPLPDALSFNIAIGAGVESGVQIAGWFVVGGGTRRISPLSKCLVTLNCKPFGPFGRGASLLRRLTNHAY